MSAELSLRDLNERFGKLEIVRTPGIVFNLLNGRTVESNQLGEIKGYPARIIENKVTVNLGRTEEIPQNIQLIVAYRGTPSFVDIVNGNVKARNLVVEGFEVTVVEDKRYNANIEPKAWAFID